MYIGKGYEVTGNSSENKMHCLQVTKAERDECNSRNINRLFCALVRDIFLFVFTIKRWEYKVHMHLKNLGGGKMKDCYDVFEKSIDNNQ